MRVGRECPIPFRSYAEQTKQKRQTKSDPNFRVAELDRIDAYFNVRAM